MTTTIPAARAHLVSLLKTAMPDVQVGYGAPTAYERHEVVSLMGVEPHEESDRALGGQGTFRDEEYTLNLVLKVYKGGVSQGTAHATAEKVEERAWALFEQVRDAVHADRSPDVLPSGWWHVSAVSTDGTVMSGGEGGAGWLALLEVDVFCRARVTS